MAPLFGCTIEGKTIRWRLLCCNLCVLREYRRKTKDRLSGLCGCIKNIDFDYRELLRHGLRRT